LGLWWVKVEWLFSVKSQVIRKMKGTFKSYVGKDFSKNRIRV